MAALALQLGITPFRLHAPKLRAKVGINFQL